MSECPFYQRGHDANVEEHWCEALGEAEAEIIGLDCDPCPHSGHDVCHRYQRARAEAAEAEVARLTDAANKWAAREQATRDKLERFIVKNHRLRDQIRELAAWKEDAERLASVLRADARAHLAEWAMQLEAEGVSSEEVERQRPNYERNDARCQALAVHEAPAAEEQTQ